MIHIVLNPVPAVLILSRLHSFVLNTACFFFFPFSSSLRLIAHSQHMSERLILANVSSLSVISGGYVSEGANFMLVLFRTAATTTVLHAATSLSVYSSKIYCCRS